MEAAPLTFEAIYTEHGGYLRSLVKAARVPEADVDDVVHEIVTSLCASGGDRAPELASARTWLFAAARNHIGKYFRRVRAREGVHADTVQAMGVEDVELSAWSDSETPEESYLREEGRTVLEIALARMQPERREVLKCRLLDGLSWSAIAEVLGIPERTAMRRFGEACRELEAVHSRWASGTASPLPLLLLLALVAWPRRADAGAPDDATAASERGSRRGALAGPPDAGEAHARALRAPSASLRRMPSVEGPRVGSAWRPWLQGVRRSRLVHFLLGGVAGALVLLLSQRIAARREALPFGAGHIPEAMAPSYDVARRDLAAPSLAPMAGASAQPAPPSAVAVPSERPSALTQAVDQDPIDRYLLGAARRAAAEGRRDDAIGLLKQHARQYPNSPRASQRDALLTQFSR